MQKILFHNAHIATAKGVTQGDVLCEGEKIAAVGPGLTAADAHVVDASGKYLLPGGVDPHTHFDLDVGFTRASDDFYTGSIAAACGGTTSVVDHMAFGPAGCNLRHQAGVYHELARPCVIDYGFHGTLQHIDDAILAEMAEMPSEGITSLKYYMTYDYLLRDEDILRVMQRAKELGLTLCVHCENDAMIQRMRALLVAGGHTQVKYHPVSRPPEAEAEAVFRSMALAKSAGEPKLYIVHLSTALGLEAARLARRFGQQNLFLESCPQYLFLTDSRNEDDVEGLKFTLSPPLRKQSDCDALWQALQTGEIDTLGTDHCPFFFESQKQRGKDNFTQCPNGMPGVELRLPLLFSEGFMAGRLPLERVVQLCCTRPAEIFGIAPQKGDIRPGADADLVLFNPDTEWTVNREELHENVDYSPYEGMRLRGKPVMTLSRGEVIVENGQFKGQRGRGRFLHRKYSI